MFRSLQTRLLVLLVVFSVIPALVLGGGLGIYSANIARRRVEDTLSAVATLKQTQVENWAKDLQISLNNEIVRDADTQRLPVLLTESPDSQLFNTLYTEQLRLFNSTLNTRGIFAEIFLMDLKGRVLISTNLAQKDQILTSRDVFRNGLQAPYLASPTYDLVLNQVTVLLSQPVKSQNGETIGVLAARAGLQPLNEIMLERTGIGQTGETYLVSKNLELVTQPRNPELVPGEDYARTLGAENAVFGQQPGSATYPNYSGIAVIGIYRWVPSLQVALLAEQAQSEAYAAANLITNITIAGLLIILMVAIIAAFLAAGSVTRPVMQLTLSAQQIAKASTTGQALSADMITVRGEDEIGTLAEAFQSMTVQLQQLIQSLEERVEQRTRQLQTRSEQLQTAAEVSRSAATLLDSHQLIQQVVELIQQGFDLYYVGLFLVDAAREWAVLQAGTGRAGQTMLERKHRLPVGEGSMIGWSIANARPRVALEASLDEVRRVNPDLPETRSEAAIPLRSRGQVIGALSVQSRLPGAFDQETIAVFQTMADQIAVAVDNARLFAESQRALDTVQQAYGRLSHQAWLEKLSAQPLIYRRDAAGLARLSLSEAADFTQHTSPANPLARGGDTGLTQNPSSEMFSLSLAVRARGQAIGAITLLKRGQPWLEDEKALLETIIDQMGASLDSARLFEETQLQAQRERLVAEVTANMRATLDIDNVLQTAAHEMLNALNLAEVEVRLSPAAPGVKGPPTGLRSTPGINNLPGAED
jgi:GAF domain-containing protein/HAMP domain-containing protein